MFEHVLEYIKVSRANASSYGAYSYYKLYTTSPHIPTYRTLGTWQEIRYTLMTFGLPVDAFPITHDEDDCSLDNHMDWLHRREKLEACSDNTTDKKEGIITEPGPLDVVMGRGYEAQIHPGNIRYRSIIAERQTVYDKSRSYEKVVVVKAILLLVKEYGGRFLRQDGHGWKLEDAQAVRTKIGCAFRDRRKAKPAPPISNAAAKSKAPKPATAPHAKVLTSLAKASNLTRG